MKNEEIQNILNWYLTNKEAIPNMMELVGILCEIPVAEDVDLDLANQLIILEINRLLEKGIVPDIKDSFVQMILELREKSFSDVIISDNFGLFLKRMVSIVLYLKTLEGKSNGEPIVYRNVEEYVSLLDLKDKLLEEGEIFSDFVLDNIAYISIHYQNAEVQLPIKYTSIRTWANFRVNPNESILQSMDAYVYPTRLQELLNLFDNGYIVPLDLVLDCIRDLSSDSNFKSTLQKIDQANLSEIVFGEVLNSIVLYAKFGPDFWHYTADVLHYQPSQEELDYIENKKKENEVLEIQYSTNPS